MATTTTPAVGSPAMNNLVRVRRALVSVTNKTDLVPFVRALRDLDIEIVSTGGTARALSKAGVDVIPVNDVTGFPEMMDGRVKTLHPAVHGAMLARRDIPAHVDAMADHDITPIDLVVINLYPFERTILDPNVSESEAIEQIDIGGPAALRSAAKNHSFVTVVTSPTQYDRLITELRSQGGATTMSLRREFAAVAFTRTAAYDAAISSWMSARRNDPFPPHLRLNFAHDADLRYGENPHQRAAVYSNPAGSELSVVKSRLIHGKPLSYNNVNDAAAGLELIADLHALDPDRPAAAVLKHATPCGAARAGTLAEAFERAYDSDPLAAFGGILALSRTVDADTATAICAGQKFLEVILAPGFSKEAADALGERWKNVRLLVTGDLAKVPQHTVVYRSILGGLLVQDRDNQLASPRDWGHGAGPALAPEVMADTAFIWQVVKHVKSNAIAIGRAGQLLGAGGGQVDRLMACRIAVEKTGDRLREGGPNIAASDAFFPFPDGPKILIDAGVNVIIHPGGSKRDEETFALCDEHDVTCLVTGKRHFRH